MIASDASSELSSATGSDNCSDGYAAKVDVDVGSAPKAVPEPQIKAPKKAKKKTPLERLLAESDWYMTQFSDSSKPRASSIKLERERDQRVAVQPALKRVKRVYTEEELQERRRKAQETRERKEREKALEREKRRKRAEERKLNGGGPKKPANKENEYYGGSELSQLMNATAHFTNIGDTYTEKREVKPVERWTPPVVPSTTRHRIHRRMKYKTLKHRSPSPKKELRKEMAKKAKKARKTKKQHNGANGVTGSTDGIVVKKESEIDSPSQSESEVEEESSWFSDLTNEDVITIETGRRLLLDPIYELQEATEIPLGLITAKEIVMTNEKEYHIGDGRYRSGETTLQYPLSPYQEPYMLCVGKHDSTYNPYDELGRMMELIAFAFFPPEERVKVINLDNPEDCIVGRYIKNFEAVDFDGTMNTINEFNTLINTLRANKTLLSYAKSLTVFPTVMVYELMNLCYSRTVLPDARKLSNYKAFSNLVYGELMPSFLTKCYKQCGLQKDSCFIDLGSGVGNCVIQAAVEFGCPSYGVEVAKDASDLGDKQAAEFVNRCKVLGLTHGTIKLFSRESFVDNPPVKEVVDRCDVILCNNYLFDAELNGKVVELLQDIKVGTKIISLKPIVPAGYTVSWENASSILSRLKTHRYIYDEGSVSWTSNGGFYFITEVMGDIVDDNFVVFQSRSRRNEMLGGRSRSSTPLNAFTNNV